MIQFDKPTNLNGAELSAELLQAGIKLKQSPLVDGNNALWLDVKSEEEAKAAVVVAAHNGTTVAPEPTIADKLASVGLSINDLKEALGLG